MPEKTLTKLEKWIRFFDEPVRQWLNSALQYHSCIYTKLLSNHMTQLQILPTTDIQPQNISWLIS